MVCPSLQIDNPPSIQGSIFAEFKEKEKAETFLGLPTIEFKGKELIKESK